MFKPQRKLENIMKQSVNTLNVDRTDSYLSVTAPQHEGCKCISLAFKMIHETLQTLSTESSSPGNKTRCRKSEG